MHIVSVINYKGGVGKTSLTANLAAELAWNGKRVLLIDLDAQASLTFSLITPNDWATDFANSGTIKQWFDSYNAGSPIDLCNLIHTPDRVRRSLKGNGHIDLIPSHLGLINVDLELATKLGGVSLEQAKRNFIAVHRRLADGLSTLEAEYDLVLIDCPPNFNIVTKTAIIASEYLLVPARPDYLSTLGIDYLIRSVSKLVKDYNDYANIDEGLHVEPIAPAVLGVVFSMIQEHSSQPIAAQRTYMSQVRNQSALTVYNSYIKRNDSLFANAPENGVPVVLNAYSSGSHQSVVDGLEAVAREFRAQIGL
ncbi:ParA family protein [uncultured Sphingomonas sp.]|uniref:ParA family protein n=1 Tax=uncultured Sphingomonas sp. TaxID=158754 RepID=UPI003747BC28